jgi:phenylacetate-CoA ligase
VSLLSERRGKFYDPWEELSPSDRQRERARRLAEYLEFARQVPFYRERLSAADLRSASPLAEVAPLTSADLRDLVPPVSERLLAEAPESYTVFQSGGTTGTPKTTLFSHRELEGLNLPNARGFWAVGLTEKDRVANLWAVGSLYMTFVHINRMLQQYGCMNFPFSNHTQMEFIHTVVTQFKVNCLSGIGSVVLNTVRGLDALGIGDLKIDKIYYGGEHLYDADKAEIKEKVGAEIIRAPGYGTVDTWYLGYQCDRTEIGVFHAHDDQTYLEIVDEDSGRACEAGQVGMLYATAFPRRVMPIVRYRVGDRAKWLGEPCSCGRTTPLFRLLGRGDDVLRVGYDSVDYGAIQTIVSEVGGLTGTVQMEKKRVEGRDRLFIRVECELEGQERASKAAALRQAIMESRPSLNEFIKKGTVWPLEVELVSAGSLPRNERTGKLIRVIDSIEDV